MSQTSDSRPTCTAFADTRLLASGALAEVAIAARRALDEDGRRAILAFDDTTGKLVEFDLRGSDEQIAARLHAEGTAGTEAGESKGPKTLGRPKLGVVAREITLLPRHWGWLATQPGGASVALRRLVDAARAANRDTDTVRAAQEAADRFMQAMLGDAPGYEEAARALYAGNAAAFQSLTEAWPADLRDHARRLAAPAFSSAAQAP